MRTITTTTGAAIDIDDSVDVLAIIEALFHARWRDDDSFSRVYRELEHLVGQLSEAECRAYLREALFMSYNAYEHEKLGAVLKKLDTSEP
jgi:hypothetical protein